MNTMSTRASDEIVRPLVFVFCLTWCPPKGIASNRNEKQLAYQAKDSQVNWCAYINSRVPIGAAAWKTMSSCNPATKRELSVSLSGKEY